MNELTAFLGMLNQSGKVFHSLIEGHKTGGAGDALEMLTHCLLGVELHTQGKMFVGAFDGFDDFNTFGHSDACNPQGCSRHVTHDLVVPGGHIADDAGATDAI